MGKKTKIDWCDSTWNPVTGCLHGCEYCYARRIAERFSAEEKCLTFVGDTKFLSPYELEQPAEYKGKKEPYPFGFSPTLHRYRLDEPKKWEKPRTIFVCSMADLFGEWVPDDWIEQVFAACRRAPRHTYLFLTKNPQRYCNLASAGKLPTEPNFWYGTTITGPDMPFFFWDKANTFVSVEPLLEPFNIDATGDENPFEDVGWVIIGAMTGPGSRKQQPKREWVEAIVKKAHEAGTAVFMKDSLKPIWGDDILREHPPGTIGGDNSG